MQQLLVVSGLGFYLSSLFLICLHIDFIHTDITLSRTAEPRLLKNEISTIS